MKRCRKHDWVETQPVSAKRMSLKAGAIPGRDNVFFPLISLEICLSCGKVKGHTMPQPKFPGSINPPLVVA